MIIQSLERAVSFSARKPLLVLALSVLLMLISAWTATQRFEMTTDTGELISADTPWRKNEANVAKAFAGKSDPLVVIIDGKTPELATDAANRLAEELAKDPKTFLDINREGGGFFDQHGLLYGSVADVKAAMAKLVAAQPLLGGLAYDPSLRGIANAIATAADGAADNLADPAVADLGEPLARLDQTIGQSLAGKPAWFSWQTLFASSSGDLVPPTRQILLVKPFLVFQELQPGAQAVGGIRAAAQRLNLDAAHGVDIGITGEAALTDEEFGSIEEGMGLIGAVMAAAMVITLWFAVRSGKVVTAIVVTILAGLLITLAAGLLMVGRLSLISVAFIPLFVGLGVDFGIQMSVRFNAERRAGAGIAQALERAAEAMGAPILLAAGAICLALGAFLPTDYVGIAELGLIAGVGMVIALVLNITLLPALLVLLKPASPQAEVGYAAAAPLDRWLAQNRRKVLIAFVLAMVASIAALPLVRFDFNPLHLRDPQGPAMRDLTKLMVDPMRTPNTLSVLAPNLSAADQVAARLSKLPEVREAITLSSLVPDDQPAKLALIEDAAFLLDPAINPLSFPPAVDDGTTLAALNKAAQALDRLAVADKGALGAKARGLADRLTSLIQAPQAKRAAVEAALVMPLNITLDKLRFSLQPGPISQDTLPKEITGDWLAADGRAMVQIIPRGNSLDNAVLERFTKAVLRVAPQAVGMPVSTQAAASTVAWAFIQAGVLALILVSALLLIVLRSWREVAFTLSPVVLSGFLTLGSCVVIGQPLNFANIIAFPLLFGVGVAFHIYFVMAWRGGTVDLLQTSLARAVLFSALATGSAFGALWFSSHPGTASMGLILMISLIWTLICALIFEPALLGPGDPGAVKPSADQPPLR